MDDADLPPPALQHGPHSVSGTTNAIRDGLSPIINDLDIDVVLTGHDHSYSRSFIIDSEGNQVDPATSETIVNAEGEVIDAPEETEGLNIGYEGRESSPRQADDTHVRVTPEEGETLFVTANSSTGSKYYDLRDVSEFRDGFQPRFRDQQYVQNITGVEVNQCTVTTNTVELDGTVVDKVELLRDHTAPEILVSGEDTVEAGGEFDPLADIALSDDCATLTTDDVEIDGEVDTDQAGEYTLTYRVADDAGNETEIERIITVVEADEEDEHPGNGNGPGSNNGSAPGQNSGNGNGPGQNSGSATERTWPE